MAYQYAKISLYNKQYIFKSYFSSSQQIPPINVSMWVKCEANFMRAKTNKPSTLSSQYWIVYPGNVS